MHISDCCQFSDIHISQGSVATYLRCGGIFKYEFVANLPVSLPVKEFWKSVNIWASYGQEFSVLFFWDTVYLYDNLYSGVWHNYKTIRDAILTWARKPTWASLMYHTKLTTNKCKTEELKSIGVNATGVAGVSAPNIWPAGVVLCWRPPHYFDKCFIFFPSAELLNTASRCHFHMHHITPFWGKNS